MSIEDLVADLKDWDFSMGGPFYGHDRAKRCMAQAAAEIIKLRAECDAATWHPIKTAPRDGTTILSTYGDASDDGTFWIIFWNGFHFECVSGGYKIEHATHWRKMPVGPTVFATGRSTPGDAS